MKNEKEKAEQKFEHPIIKIIRFETEDIMTTSGTGGGETGIDLPIDPF